MQRILTLALALFAMPLSAFAQDFPDRVITLVAPFPPGGPSDTTARMIIGPMSQALGQQIIVENVTGAGSTIGTARVADVIAGKADVCAVTAASVIAELNAGRLRVLAITTPARLAAPFANVPTWNEQGADCVIGAWRVVSGPSGLSAAQVTYWEDVIRAATRQPCWAEDLARLNWAPQVATGAPLRAYLDQERAEFVAVLGELGLLKR